MVTTRTVLAGGCLALAMVTAGACVQVNEAMNSRDLECTGVPDDICAGLADHIVRQWDPDSAAQFGPIVKVKVTRVDCGRVQVNPANVRCWEVASGTAGLFDGSRGAGVGDIYGQRVDGTIWAGDTAIGDFPLE